MGLFIFDEFLFFYFEDLDWSIRARQAGFKLLYYPGVKILHVAGAALKSPSKGIQRTKPVVYYLYARNNILVIKKHHKGLSRLVSITGYFIRFVLFYSLIFVGLRRIEKLKSLWMGVVDGLNGNPARVSEFR